MIASGAWYFLAASHPAPSVATTPVSTEAPRLSLVVLPFANLSNDPEQDYFADGITDDLTTDLSHLPESFVIARGTAFTYKGKAVDAKQIGRELEVRYVLEGSVRRLGEQITVNAQLISTRNKAHLWADRFDGERSRLGELQVEFVARLANSLNVELIRAESLRALRERPNNPDAVDLVMRGQANLESAGVRYPRPTSIRPSTFSSGRCGSTRSNPRRWIGLSKCAHPTGQPGLQREACRGYRSRHGFGLASALGASGKLRSAFGQGWDLICAEAMGGGDRRGRPRGRPRPQQRLGPLQNRVLHGVYLGRAAEGFSGVETALRLNPRDPGRGFWEYQICHLHTHLMQWDQAIEWCRRSVATRPRWFAYLEIAADYAWTGRDADARAAVAELLKLKPGLTVQQAANAGKKMSDNPTFQREADRIYDGLRKAGLPEQ